MNENVGVRPKPEEEELHLKRRDFEIIEKQLVERELQLVSLRGELATFERIYVEKVGSRYAELDEIDAQIAEFHASCAPDDVGAQNEARDARSRAGESRASTAGLELQDTIRFSPSSSLKSLYREVARRIHPDLAVDEVDRAKRQRLMAEANWAYEMSDEARLRAILEEYESSPESFFGEGTAAELVRVIRKIAQVKRRLAEIDDEFKQVMASDLFELKRKVDKGTNQGRDILSEMAAAVNARIEERRGALRTVSENKRK
jgi:hypothetical protein